MKKNNRTFTERHLAMPLIAVVLCVLLAPDRCKAQNTALLLQQTPPNGGILTPGSGVHSFGTNTDITLKAVPNPGYQFVYWLGDVSDSRANVTIVSLDVPKIIIAVFERSKYEFPFLEQMINGAPIGGMAASSADYTRQSYTGGGAKRPSKYRGPGITQSDQPPDFPTPDDDGDFPVPEVPEPATALLMALGAAISCLKRRQKYKN